MPPKHHRSRNTKSELEKYEDAGKARSESDRETKDGMLSSNHSLLLSYIFFHNDVRQSANQAHSIDVPQDCDELWEKTLARSLCCEPYFLELMRNRSEVLQFEFRKPWLACIHLPYRYARYKNFNVSTRSMVWWSSPSLTFEHSRSWPLGFTD